MVQIVSRSIDEGEIEDLITEGMSISQYHTMREEVVMNGRLEL